MRRGIVKRLVLVTGCGLLVGGTNLFAQLLCPVAALGYAYQKTITIDHNNVSGGSNLINFPVLINISASPELRTVTNLGHVEHPNGYDIIFTDKDYNKLDQQVESYTATNGNLIVWVRIPELSASVNTTVLMLYGNPQISNDPSVKLVWDQNFKGVWHLNGNDFSDATSNANNAINHGSVDITGQIGNGKNFNGTSDFIDAGNSSSLFINNAITVSSWVNSNNPNDGHIVNMGGGWADPGYSLFWNNGNIRVELQPPNTYYDAPIPSYNLWHYIAFTWDINSKLIQTFIDGVVVGSGLLFDGPIGNPMQNLYIGNNANQSGHIFNGKIDEARVQSIARPAGWILTEYNNQVSPGTFYNIGNENTCSVFNFENVCPGTPVIYSVPNTTGHSYNWTIIGGIPSANIGNSINITWDATGPNTIQLQEMGGCVGNSLTYNVTVAARPVAISTPISQFVCSGDAFTNIVLGTSNGVVGTTFSWLRNNPAGITTTLPLSGSGLAIGAAISGSFINSTSEPIIIPFIISPAGPSPANCVGNNITSNVTVNPTAQVNQPVSEVVCNGAPTAATVFGSTNTGGTVTYTWTNDQPTIGLPASGNGNISSFTAVNIGNSPVTATITVTPHFSNGSVTCDGPVKTYSKTVNPTAQVNQPVSEVVCNGAPTAATVFGSTNTGGTVTYTWTNNDITIGLAANGIGDIGSFTAINTGTVPVVATIIVTPHFTNGGKTCDGPAKTFTITVNPTAQVNQPASEVVCNGDNTTAVTFATVNTIGATTYTWTNSSIIIGLAANGIGDIGSFAAINTGTTPVVATIIVTPHFTDGGKTCDGPAKTFTITVNPTAQVNQPAGVVICNGDNTTAVTFATVNTTGVTTYTWTNSAITIGLAANGIGDIGSFAAINTGIVPVVATIIVTPHFANGGKACNGPAKTFTITVNPSAQVNQLASEVVCNGDNTTAVTFATVNTLGATTYTWTNSAITIGLAANGIGDLGSFTAINSGTAPVVATIIVTPHFTNGGKTCDGPAKTFTITVNPTAQIIQPASAMVCNGDNTTAVIFATVNTLGSTTYTWTNSSITIGLAANGIGDIGSFAAKNTGTAPVVATIIVTPHFANGGKTCDGPAKTFTITVNPSAQVNQPASEVVCNGGNTTAVTFATVNTIGATTYTWTNSSIIIGLAANGIGDIGSFTAINSGTAPVVATIIVTPHFTNGGKTCDGPTKTFTITVNPTAQVNLPLNQVLCTETPTISVTFGTTNTEGVTTYKWTNNQTSIGLAANGSGNIGSFKALNGGNGPVIATITVTPFYTNGGVTCDGPLKTFTITVDPSPQVVPSTLTQTICNNESTYIIVGSPSTFSSGVIMFNYFVEATGGVTGFTTPVKDLHKDYIIADVLHNPTNTPQTVTYTILPIGGFTGCGSGPAVVVVTVNPEPQVNQPPNDEVCNGSATTPVLFSTMNTGGTVSYTWTNNQPSIGLAASGSGNIPSFTAVNTGNSPVTAIINVTPHFLHYVGLICDGPLKTFTITVNPRPRIAVATDEELCYNDPARFDITRLNTVNTGAVWYYDLSPVTYPAGVTGTWAAGLMDQTATGIAALADNLINNTNNVQTVSYTFTPHVRPGDGGPECTEGVAVPVTIRINPRPQIAVTTDAELCFNDPARFDITRPNIVNTGATWYYDLLPVTYPAGVTGSWALGLTDQTATGIAALTDNLVNNTNDVQTVNYTFIPHVRPGDVGPECTGGATITIAIRINPRPRIIVSTDLELCYNDPAKFDITRTNIVNTDAAWYYDLSPVTYPAGVTGILATGLTNQTATGIAALTDNLVNNTNDVQTVIYKFTPHIKPGDGGPECTGGAAVTVTTRINPRPRIAVATDEELCYNDPAWFDIIRPNTVNSGATWYYDLSPVTYPAGVTGILSPGLTDQTATGISALTDNLVNNTNDVQTVSYTFTPHIKPGDGGPECTGGAAVTVTLRINPRPRVLVTTDLELCYNDPAKFDITRPNTVNTGATWYYDLSPVTYPAGVTGILASGLTNQTATGIAALADNLVNNTNDVQTVNYTFTPHIKPGDGGPECTGGAAVTVTIRINPRPLILVTTDLELCYNDPAKFDITRPNTVNTGATWYYDLSPVTYPAGVTGILAPGLLDQTATGIAALTDNLVNNTNNVQTVIYKFTPHIRPGDGGPECTGGAAVTVTIRINPRPRILVATDLELCYNDPARFDITRPNSVNTGATWYYDLSPVTYPAGVTGILASGLTNQTATGIAALTDNLVNNTTDVQTVIYKFTPHIRPGDGGSECTGGATVTVTIRINPRPHIVVAADGEICYNDPARFDITRPNTVSTGATWYYDLSPVTYPAGVTGILASGLTDQTSTGIAALTDNLVNNTNDVQTVNYTFIPHIRPGDGGPECTGGAVVTVTIRINPRPRVLVTTDLELCYNDPARFDITRPNTVSSGATWYYDLSPVTYPAGVTGGSWGSGLTDQTATGIAALTDNLFNNTNDVQTVIYKFTPHIRPGDGGSECTGGAAVTVTIRINPLPRVLVTTDLELCPNDPAIFEIIRGNIVNTGATWYYDISPVTYPAGVSGSWASGLTDRTSTGIAALTDYLVNNTNDVQTVSYTFTPHIRPGDGGSECTGGVADTVIIRINPLPRIFPVQASTIQCDSTITSILIQSPSKFTSGLISFRYNVTSTGAVTGFTTPTGGLSNNIYISDKLVNQTDHYQVVTYRVVPISPVGCIDGPAQDVNITVNPTPRAIPDNLKPAICFGGTTEIVLKTPTVMTSGAIRFDYTVSFTGVPGDVVGNSAPGSNLVPEQKLTFSYQNSAPPSRIDNVNSVLFAIRPKVVGLGCNAGNIVTPEVQVHPKTIKFNYPGTNGTGILITKQLTCEISSGLAALEVIVTKWADPYQIRWTGPIGYTNDSIEIKNLNIGKYTVRITDNLGCRNDSSINIVPFTARPQISSPPLLPNIHVSCPGGSDGSFRVNVSAGITAPYRFWVIFNNADTLYNGVFTNNYNPSDPNTFRVFNNLKAGNYSLIIRDVKGCYITRTTELKEPAPIAVEFSKSNYNGFDVSCGGYSNGFALAQPTGGNSLYSYLWYKATGSLSVSTTTNLLDSIPAGKYYLITTDQLSCTKIDSVTIIEPNGMQLTGSEFSISPDGNTNISCNGGNDGFIKLKISGGSGVYTYSWTGPNGFSATTRDISGLKAGVYTFTVMDLNGCIMAPSPSFTLTEPPGLAIASKTSTSNDGLFNINCNGGAGSINITVTGGSAGSYKFDWSTSNGSGIINWQKDQFALTAGTYLLVVTDSNNCIKTKEITLTQPPSLITQLSATHITCQSAGFNNGSINLTVSGGAPPYTYLWSNHAITEDITGLTQGYYRVNVTYNSSCVKTDSIRVNLPPPVNYTKILSDYNGFNIICNGLANGSIQINPSSGLAPFVYNWTGPNGFTSTLKDISNLKAGQYVLSAKDNNYCIAKETINITEPGKLGMTINLSESIAGGFNINCAGNSTGSIGIEPVNQVKTVNYLWSDGITSKTRINLPADDYSIIITDVNNCHANAEITLTEPDSMKLIFDISRPFCPDKPDGEIRLNVTGGVMGTGYSYKWSDNSTSGTASNIIKGFYKVTVKDLNGCSIKDSVNIEPLNETCLIIPNAISPNDDLINDVWNIGMTELYPEMEIQVFNRWGETVWRSEKGYPQPWDGRSNGSPLPIDSYHYIIDLHNGSKLFVGNVTIVR